MAHIIWDPPREFWTLPVIGYPLVWYGLFFALGFFLAYLVMRHLVRRESQMEKREVVLYTDRLLWFAIIGVLGGARLAEVFFYDWPYYRENLVEIFKIWKGGLASHGGVAGVILSVLLFQWTYGRRKSSIGLLQLLDMLVIPTTLLAVFIRMGNFFNQEILGTPTDLPWAMIFPNPLGGGAVVPRHPVQLYAAGFYLFTFFALYFLRRKEAIRLRPGFTLSLSFVWIFSFRFLLEFIKERQEVAPLDEAALHMGQLLSIPFIALGAMLLIWSVVHKKNARTT